MNWFRRPTPEYINITKPRAERKDDGIPKDLWHKCPNCGTLTIRKDFEAVYSVCPACDRHERISAGERIELMVDKGSFEGLYANIVSKAPLNFEAKGKYSEKYEANRKKTRMNEAVMVGRATIGEVPSALAVMDFFFMGGSMGSAVGEKITRAMELAIAEDRACIIVTASGGARMQEGILSLMQLAKTSILCAKIQEAKIPFISILTDPSTGGTMASFASLGDIIIGEPGAMIGFAGKRVMEQTIKQQLPPNFQTAEFQEEQGFLDMVVHRREMRGMLIRLLRMMRGMPALPPEADEDSETLNSSAKTPITSV